MKSCSDRWCFSHCQLVMYVIASRCFPVALLRPPSTIAQKLVRSLRLFAWDEARASTLCSVRWCRRSSGVALCGAFAALISCRLGRPCFFCRQDRPCSAMEPTIHCPRKLQPNYRCCLLAVLIARPPASFRHAGGQILVFAEVESGRNPARNSNFRPGRTSA